MKTAITTRYAQIQRVAALTALGFTMLATAAAPAYAQASPTPTPVPAVNSNNPTPVYPLLEPLPCVPSSPTIENGVTINPGVTCKTGGGSYIKSVTFQDYVQYFFNLIIALSAAAAVFMIAAGGLQYMTTDSWQDKGAGKDKIKNALIGLVIVLCSYFILRTVDPRLVSIPTTLVAPLHIQYTNQVSLFINALNSQVLSVDQGNTLRAQNAQLLNDIAVANTQINDLETQKSDIGNQLADLVNGGNYVSEDQMTQFCNSSVSGDDKTVLGLCTQYNAINNSENQVQSTITSKTAFGLMNAQVEKCLSSGGVSQATSDACTAASQAQISQVTRDSIQTLQDLGQADLAQKVASYGVYSGNMAQINNILSTTQTSPNLIILMGAIQSFNTAFDTALGAYLASPAMFQAAGKAIDQSAESFLNQGNSLGVSDASNIVNSTAQATTKSGVTNGLAGAVAGYSIANYVNSLSRSGLDNRSKAAAAKAAQQITAIVTNTQDMIKDPDMKQVFLNQTQQIISALTSASK